MLDRVSVFLDTRAASLWQLYLQHWSLRDLQSCPYKTTAKKLNLIIKRALKYMGYYGMPYYLSDTLKKSSILIIN
jgi:hypothetical protein